MSQNSVLDDPKKNYAAQNVREGLITVLDLSHLTGLEVAQLTKFAKTGQMVHYGEYHGKRFFNFEELVVWASTAGDDLARTTLRKAIETQLELPNCPYELERVIVDGEMTVKVIWKDLPPQ